MTSPFTPLELLSPARDFETARAAILHGADAVYMGGPGFGARAAAGNSFDDLAKTVEIAHTYRARVYMTLNTVVFDSEIEEALGVAQRAKEIGVDALIVQDMGLLEAGLPDIEIHASTQCDIRTPEKAALLDALGFSQVVPARELTLEEIAAIRRAMPRSRIEFFIAGALCVSFSGQCYLSCALNSRSANRGECSQPCRLAYDVEDLEGNPVCRQKHVLSLKDNDQSANLEALINAGVSSFKIEGRLKGSEYVKNITAWYRRKIDLILEKHAGEPGWVRSSEGVSDILFEPDPAKTFRRSATDYFVNGRRSVIAELDTPKSTGEFLGTVAGLDAGRRTVDIKTKLTVANADGLLYVDDKGETRGMHVNRAEALKPGLVRIHLHESLASHTALKPGLALMRNKDKAFVDILAHESATRTLPVNLTFEAQDKSLRLKAETLGVEVTVEEPFDVQPAKDPAKAKTNLEASLAKTGGTVFRPGKINIQAGGGQPVPFVPASVINRLRRDVLERLREALIASHTASTRLEATLSPEDMPFAGRMLDFTANAANRYARSFYKRLGAQSVAAAFEVKPAADLTQVPLMHCRHCVRHVLKLCPKMLKGKPEQKAAFKAANGGKLKPLPLILTTPTGTRLIARFDCRACEMTVSLA